ncbi:hypothetical protein Tco_1062448 [Tanacetum coccineum]
MNELPCSTQYFEANKVLDLEEAKTAQAKEIASLKKRFKQLEQRRKSRTSGLKRKVGSASRVESSTDVSLVTLIDETQERYDEEMLFDLQDDLQGEEVVAEKEVSAANPVTTAGKPKAVTTAATTITTVVASTRPKIKARKKMVEPENPLKKKDQIALDEELALRLHAQEQAELERMQKERVAQEEASRAAIIEELDRIQAMIEADEQLAARL